MTYQKQEQRFVLTSPFAWRLKQSDKDGRAQIATTMIAFDCEAATSFRCSPSLARQKIRHKLLIPSSVDDVASLQQSSLTFLTFPCRPV